MKKKFDLEDLDCANCAAKMEARLKEMDGINDASVNFMTQKLMVDAATDDKKEFKKLMKQVQKEMNKVEPDCTIIM